MQETAERLKALQPGKFERLAGEILRCQPGYGRLVTSGLNQDDRAVADPLDGILVVAGSNPPIVVALAHTAETRPARLREKWLAQPIGRRRKGPGDLVKAARQLEEARQRLPNAVLRVVLTCQVEPPSKLVPEVEAYCRDRGLELELWSGSGLCSFLDNNPQGHWLRREYLGIDAELLSFAQLRELSAISLADYERSLPVSRLAPVVERAAFHELKAQVFGHGGSVCFVVAESGFGKSIAALWLFRLHLAGGGCGLWLKESIVDQGIRLQDCVETYLRALAPKLAAGCGAEALELCKPGGLLVVVDDISRLSSASRLLHLLSSWGEIEGEQDRRDELTRSVASQPWHLVCPVWPRFVDPGDEPRDKRLSALCFHLGAMTREESVQALLARANATDIVLTEVQSNDLAEQCGDDPLLLGLVDLSAGEKTSGNTGQTAPVVVIKSFVDRSLRRLADDGSATRNELLSALVELGWWMLDNKKLDPAWPEVASGFKDSEELTRLRKIAAQREVFSLQDPKERETLRFRHDRVRDHICARALHRAFSEGRDVDQVLSDPFFAEVIGQALLVGELTESWPARVREANPLALFGALRLFREPTTATQHAVVREIRAWLQTDVAQGKCNDWLLWEVQDCLRRTDSPLVLEFCQGFSGFSWYLLEARFRNGDAQAGAEYVGHHRIGLGFAGTEQLVAHVGLRFGQKIVPSVAQLLRADDRGTTHFRGALILAGYLAEPELVPAIQQAWKGAAPSPDLLACFLWAACCCDPRRLDEVAGPMVEHWRGLSDTPSEPRSTPEISEVSFSLEYAFDGPRLDSKVVHFLRDHGVGKLEWPIQLILREADHPLALEAAVRYVAARPRYAFGSWRWERFGLPVRPMSLASLEKLKSLWLDESESAEVRKRAFWLWQAANTGPTVAILREIRPESPVFEQAIRFRARQGDQTVTQAMIHAIRTDEHPTYRWGDVAAIWNPALMAELDSYLAKLRSSLVPGEWESKGLEHETSELLTAIPLSDAEALLEKHWSHLQFRHDFVQAGLRIATPTTCSLVEATLVACPSPKEVLSHLGSHMETIRRGREQRLEHRHFEALLPYLHWLDQSDLTSLWSLCNRFRHFAFRRAHIDPLLSRETRLQYGAGVEGRFAQLDRLLTHQDGQLWIDQRFEQAKRDGETWTDFLPVLLEWAKARGSTEALKVVAEAVAQFGSRAELAVLEALEVPEREIAQRVRAETTFRVQRRTLQ